MPYVQVPKDLSTFRSKTLFGLTTRQLICFGLGGAVGIPVYLLVKPFIGVDAAGYLLMAVAFPLIAFGIFRKNELPLEKFLLKVIKKKFAATSKRIYRTENLYGFLERAGTYDEAQTTGEEAAVTGKEKECEASDGNQEEQTEVYPTNIAI